MLPHPDIGNATLDRQLFTYLEQPIALVPAPAAQTDPELEQLNPSFRISK